MSCAVRPAPDRTAFIAAVDRYAAEFDLPGYSELVRLLGAQERLSSDLHAALIGTTARAAAAEVCLLHDGADMAAAAYEQASAGRQLGNAALKAAEARTDVADAPGVAVLAVHRERLRAAGRRA